MATGRCPGATLGALDLPPERSENGGMAKRDKGVQRSLLFVLMGFVIPGAIYLVPKAVRRRRSQPDLL